MKEYAPDSKPSEAFPLLIRIEFRLPERETVRRGFCQLSLSSFRQLYTMLGKHIKLPPLSKHPQIIEYADNSIALSWWPHQLYRSDREEIVDHEGFIIAKEATHHEEYIQEYPDFKKDFERELERSFKQEKGNPTQASENFETLKEENRILRKRLSATEENLRISKIEK